MLGLVQGMTELLPISSSGHLILVPWLFDWTYLKENDAFNQTFDVSLHLGTCVAVGAYFWHDVVTLLGAWFGTLGRRSIKTTDERLAWVVLVATIPAALVGFLLEDVIAEHMGEPWQIAIFLAVFGLLLGWADRRPQRYARWATSSLRQGLLVGLAQSLALMPGVSRSGITITAGRFLGLDRDSAARFSFLLLLPITVGAVVFKGHHRRDPGRSAVGHDGAVRRRRAGLARVGARRDPVPARLRAPAQLRRVRRLPPGRRRRDPAADRDRRPLGDVLDCARMSSASAAAALRHSWWPRPRRG